MKKYKEIKEPVKNSKEREKKKFRQIDRGRDGFNEATLWQKKVARHFFTLCYGGGETRSMYVLS